MDDFSSATTHSLLMSSKLNGSTENFKTMKAFNFAVKEYLRNKSELRSIEINKYLAVILF